MPDAAGLEAIRAGLAAVFERQYGPLRGAGLAVSPDTDVGFLQWTMQLLGPDGQIAADIARAGIRDGDNIQVAHEFFGIYDTAPPYAGRGIGRLFGAYSEQWYRESGVQVITLTAGLDDGGYVWAMAGYTWVDTPRDVIQRLAAAITHREGTPEELAQARVMLGRLEHGTFGSVSYPTPRDIATIGRTGELARLPSRDPRKTWFGRRVMKGSTWQGQKAP